MFSQTKQVITVLHNQCDDDDDGDNNYDDENEELKNGIYSYTQFG